ncbi:MAG TPA: POTRA domain-containing protein [Vicinamibacterales bacterium]|nr:POTRA domain-containing protein [Vicinamibacterales bacterium]
MHLRSGIVAIVLCVATQAFAQPAPESYSGRPVNAVRVLIDGAPTTDASLIDLLETRPGQTLSMAAVRESIAHLYSLARFQDVQVEAIDGAGGAIELRYNLVAVRAVDKVEFRGTLGLSEGLLRDTVTERFGRAPQPGRAQEVTRELERLYQDRGYFQASIRPGSAELHNPERTILTFDIDAGPQARVGEIAVVGNPRAGRQELLRRLDLATGQPYRRAQLNARLADYTRRLKKRGYLQAEASHSSRVSEDGRVADVTIDVQSGPTVTVTFEGDQLPSDKRNELVPFEREGSVDEDLREDSVQRIRDYLNQEGYWKADVIPRQQESDDALAIIFTVRKGPVYRVASEGVQIIGNSGLSLDEIRPLLVLKPGDLYVASHLDATVGALVRLYRTRGFRWVDVKPSEIDAGNDGGGNALIRPVITIVEGPRAVLGEVTVTGAKALSEPEIQRVLQLQAGQPYYEPSITAARDALQLEYLNLGYSSVQVSLAPTLSEDRTRVSLAIDVVEGAQTLVDHIIVVGNTRTSEDIIRREVLLRPGAPLGLKDLLESRRRLSSLGLFRRIDVRQLEHGQAGRRDVLITVEEAPATAIGYGGGLEATSVLRAGLDGGGAEERLELAPRGFFDIGRRNLGGKNRSINLFTRVAVRPRTVPDSPELDGRGFGLSEYRVVGTYREPAATFWNADLLLTAAAERGVRSSFSFERQGVSAELTRRVSRTIRASGRYSFGTTRTFDERLSDPERSQIDRLFPHVRLAAFSGAVSRDTRDDVVEPTGGAYVSGEASVAVRFLGGEVGFVKTYFQGSWFKRLPGERGIVFATRATVGLADGLPREAQPTDEEGRPIEGPPIVIEDLPASERFFTGGDTTIRGFAVDSVGTPETITPRGFPRGGNGLLILNAELRIPVWKDFGAALFSDGGNVFERVTDFDPSELRGSVGFGVRYRSPIGPIRVDLGFKMDRRLIAGELEKRTALHFSIGQAF